MIRRLFKGKVAPPPQAPAQIQDEMVQDPVCQTYIPKRMALMISTPQGREIFFCSETCRDQYLVQADKGRVKEKG